jgi:hypothetical protein
MFWFVNLFLCVRLVFSSILMKDFFYLHILYLRQFWWNICFCLYVLFLRQCWGKISFICMICFSVNVDERFLLFVRFVFASMLMKDFFYLYVLFLRQIWWEIKPGIYWYRWKLRPMPRNFDIIYRCRRVADAPSDCQPMLVDVSQRKPMFLNVSRGIQC